MASKRRKSPRPGDGGQSYWGQPNATAGSTAKIMADAVKLLADEPQIREGDAPPRSPALEARRKAAKVARKQRKAHRR